MPIKTEVGPREYPYKRLDNIDWMNQAIMDEAVRAAYPGQRMLCGCLITENSNLIQKILDVMDSMPLFMDEAKSEFMGYEVGFAGKDFWISVDCSRTQVTAASISIGARVHKMREMQKVFSNIGVELPDEYFGKFAVAINTKE